MSSLGCGFNRWMQHSFRLRPLAIQVIWQVIPTPEPIPIAKNAKGQSEEWPKCFFVLVGREGFEPSTYGLRDDDHNLLFYTFQPPTTLAMLQGQYQPCLN